MDAAQTAYVTAAVLASDALCIFDRGEFSRGDDHAQALALLRSVADGAALAKHLATALDAKKRFTYDISSPSPDEMTRLRRATEALVAAAQSRM